MPDVYIIRAVDCYPKLIEIAKYSQDNDIKTAACFISRTGTVDDRPFVYSYNQSIDMCMVHAEEVCLMYYDIYAENEGSLDLDAVSLLEPCVKCLTNMIDAGIKRIAFGYAHKEKWNTDEYWQVVDDIHARIYNTVYERIKDKSVDKFYERSKNVNNV